MFQWRNMRNYNRNMPSQKDNWSCNLQMMLATDAFVSALLDKKKYITNADREDDFKSFGKENMTYNVSDVHIIRQDIFKILEGILSLRNNIPSLRRTIQDRINTVEYDQLIDDTDDNNDDNDNDKVLYKRPQYNCTKVSSF